MVNSRTIFAKRPDVTLFEQEFPVVRASSGYINPTSLKQAESPILGMTSGKDVMLREPWSLYISSH